MSQFFLSNSVENCDEKLEFLGKNYLQNEKNVVL
mgnify:CR=1 FL=1